MTPREAKLIRAKTYLRLRNIPVRVRIGSAAGISHPLRTARTLREAGIHSHDLGGMI